MALANVSNQLLRSAGEGTEVVANSPITGNGTSVQPLGIDENWHGQDGESVTFTVSAIPSGTRVTLSGAQGTESFDVMNGVDGTNGTDGAQGPEGPQGPQGDPGVQGETGPQGIQGERGPAGPQGEQGEQGPAGQDGKSAYEIAVEDGFSGNVYEWLESLHGEDGISPTFSAVEDDEGVTVTISGAQGEESFRLYNATGESTPYSAGPNIDITDHVISGRDWTDEISAASANAVSQIPDVSEFLTKSSADTLYYPLTSNPSGYLIAHQSLSAYYQKNETSSKQEISDALDDKLDKTQSGNFYPMTGNPSGFLTTHQSLSNYYQKNETSSKQEIQAALEAIPGAVDYSAGANINITNHVISGKDWSSDLNSKLDESTFTAYTAVHTGDDVTQYSAGSNINITNHVISGKDWSSDITAASAATTAWVNNQNYLTTHQSLAGLMSADKLEYDSNNKISGYNGSAFAGEDREIIPVRGDNGISVTEVNNDVVIEISSVAHDTTLSGYGTPASPLGVVGGGSTLVEYTAGANIDITNHVVSGKDWSNDITAASSYAYSQATADAQGHTYTGVAPIVVNNNEDKISADCIELRAGNGIDSTKLATGVIEVSSQGGGSNFSTSAFGIIPSTQVTALTSLSYYDTGLGKSNQLSGNNTNNLGWTMPSAYANVKSDVIADADAQVQSRYSYKLSYTSPTTGFTANSGLEIRKYVGNTGTTRKVLSGNSTLGELVPEDYTSKQYLSTNAAGNMVWDDIANISPIVLVATSGDIPASGASDNKVYIVTGNS